MFGLPTEYYKTVADGFITSIGMGRGGVRIDKTAFDALRARIAAKPEAREGYEYRLRDDGVTWEESALPSQEAPDAQ